MDANSAFPDPVTGKAREIDISAMTAERAGPGKDDWLFAVLLMECVNNPQPLALITKAPQVAFLQREDLKASGLPVKFPLKGALKNMDKSPGVPGD